MPITRVVHGNVSTSYIQPPSHHLVYNMPIYMKLVYCLPPISNRIH